MRCNAWRVLTTPRTRSSAVRMSSEVDGLLHYIVLLSLSSWLNARTLTCDMVCTYFIFYQPFCTKWPVAKSISTITAIVYRFEIRWYDRISNVDRVTTHWTFWPTLANELSHRTTQQSVRICDEARLGHICQSRTVKPSRHFAEMTSWSHLDAPVESPRRSWLMITSTLLVRGDALFVKVISITQTVHSQPIMR